MITIEHYIASNNPKKAQAILNKYGVPKGTKMHDLIKKVHVVSRRHKEHSMADLAKIDTPYKRLILAHHVPEPIPVVVTPPVATITTVTPIKVEKKSNACGCSGADGSEEESSNCSGCGGGCGDKESNIISSNASGTDTKTAATSTNEAAPVKSNDTVAASTAPVTEKKDYTPALVVLGILGLIAVVVIAKHK